MITRQESGVATPALQPRGHNYDTVVELVAERGGEDLGQHPQGRQSRGEWALNSDDTLAR